MKAAIDLKGFIKDKGLNKAEIAIQLFPDNKFPKLALDRVLKGESALDANQISKLSAMTNTSIGDLFNTGGWKSSGSFGKLKFTKGEYQATFDRDTKLTSVYHEGSMVHEFIIHAESITLSDYITELESQIKKLK